MKPAGVICDSACGCPVPCAGGIACKCASGGAGGGSRAVTEHRKCSCGEHCGCNPCICDQGSTIAGAGKGNCKCGPGCNCTTCAT